MVCVTKQGDGNRCSRSSSKRCCYRSSRTSRGSGSGCSYRHSATRHHWSCSCSNPEGETHRQERTSDYWCSSPKIVLLILDASCPRLMPRGMRPPWRTPLREFLETATDARVRVRSGVVTAQVEQAVALELVVATATAQHDTTGAVVAVIANVSRFATCNGRRIESIFEARYCRNAPCADVSI
jgi:hypothetical protein